MYISNHIHIAGNRTKRANTFAHAGNRTHIYIFPIHHNKFVAMLSPAWRNMQPVTTAAFH